MILTDTSIVVRFYRTTSLRLRRIIKKFQAAICGVTIAEIHSGARTKKEQNRCTAILGLFPLITITDATWSTLGQNLCALRSQGLIVPFPDALIATVAIEQTLELWTYDSHFVHMQNVLPALRLFHEPP